MIFLSVLGVIFILVILTFVVVYGLDCVGSDTMRVFRLYGFGWSRISRSSPLYEYCNRSFDTKTNTFFIHTPWKTWAFDCLEVVDKPDTWV